MNFDSNELLTRDSMKAIMGGKLNEGCGSCNNPSGAPGSYGCYKQQGGPTHGDCRCMWQDQQCS